MTELCIRIYHYFRGHRFAFWASMLALFAFFGFYASRIHLEEDIAQLLPASKNPDGTTKLAFADLRIKDKTFLLLQADPDGSEGWDGDARVDTLIAAGDAIVAQMTERLDAWTAQTGDTILEDVFAEVPLDDLLFAGIDYMTAQLPCYIDTSVYASIDTLLTYDHVVRQMERNRADLTGSLVGTMFPELIQMDPLGLRSVLTDQVKAMTEGLGGTYKVIRGHFFVPDTTVMVVFLTPHFSSTNTGHGAILFETLGDVIESHRADMPGIKVCYHGAPARGANNSWQIKSDIRTTVVGSLIVVLLFLFVCFRNWDTIPLLLLPVAFGALFGLAMMYFIKGQFSLLALGIGAIVLGVALSYVLHVLTHYKYVSDPVQVLRDQVVPVFLGCLTTIGSFVGLIFIDTELLQDFGLFATFSIVGTTAFSLLYLPQFFDASRNKLNRRAFALIDRINVYPFDRKPLLLGVIGLAVAVCVGAWCWMGTDFDADMRNLGYMSDDVTYSEELLRAKTHTGDRNQYFATSGQTMEEALTRFGAMRGQLDSLRSLGLVKSYTPTDRIFVPLGVQQQRIDAWHAYWTDERLHLVADLIQRAAPRYDLAPEAFEPFFEAARAPYEPSALYEADILPRGFLSTLMEQSKDGSYLCFTTVRCANDSVRSDSSDYTRICDAIAPRPHQMVLDTYYYTTDTLRQLDADFSVLQWVSMGFVFLVLLFSFRFRLGHTLLGFAPILVSWLVVLGAMALCGRQFNLINIIISTFIFGIGVDYSIFVMNGLMGGSADAVEEGHGQNARLLLSYHKTAILFSAVTLIVTVASMLLARHPAIQSVGFATLVGMVSAVVLSYVVQPALYRLLTRHRDGRSRRA